MTEKLIRHPFERKLTKMLRSLFSGVSGLKAHQSKMDVIGNNIANVNTYGFKASRTTFRDVYYQTISSASNASGTKGGANATQVGYGTSVGSIDMLNTRSGFASTGLGTDCYIDGEGYFVIKDGSGNERLTQVGTFGFDGNGNMVDGNKNFVCGYAVDKVSGKVSVGGSTIDFGTGNGELLDGYTVKVVYAKPDQMTDAAASTKIAADTAEKSLTITYTPAVSGGAVTGDTTLTPANLQTALQNNANWSWTNNGAAAPAPTDFDAAEQAAITVAGTANLTETTGMVAQVAHFDYTKAPEKIINSYGELKNLSIGADGIVTGEDTNGKIKVIGQIALANVPNPNALTLEGNSYFKPANNVGTLTYYAPGSGNLGALKTGGLEMSNVDLANEFSDMIMTQRGFQANSKIITVSDEMLDTLVNLKR